LHFEAGRGLTPREAAKLLRISPDRVRAMIRRGKLGAINLARHRCGRPRFVVLPSHLADFVRGRQAATPAPPKPKRKKHPSDFVDYYPD
jgi:excisionase family DNA binding protein